MKQIIEKYWAILGDYEDSLIYGIKTDNRPKIYFNRRDTLDVISFEVENCRKCALSEKRTKTVPGTGAVNPEVLVIGEGPGADEDRQGLPFVGAAGKYLDKWLDAIGLLREKNCYIGNLVKCRPPGNRDPLPQEISACINYLERQIKILKPKAILTLGRISSSVITGEENGIGRTRGRVHNYKGIPVIATYHPSAVLRDKSYRAAVWEDLKLLQETLKNTEILKNNVS